LLINRQINQPLNQSTTQSITPFTSFPIYQTTRTFRPLVCQQIPQPNHTLLVEICIVLCMTSPNVSAVTSWQGDWRQVGKYATYSSEKDAVLPRYISEPWR